MKYKFIMENRKEFRVGKMCKVLNVSRSGYHNYVKRRYSRRENDEIIILEKIKEIHKNSRGLYGSPRIYQELRKRGLKINKKRVVRIMQKYGIRAKTRKKFKKTTNSNHNNPIAKDLLGQNFKSRESNKIWVSDITYIRTREGWLYLSCILDLYSRMIVGWQIDRRQTSSLVTEAIGSALAKRGKHPGLIFHSDKGSQYASEAVRDIRRDSQMVQSMSRKGNCYDNAVMESFFHTLKNELVSFETFTTREEAKMKIFDYIEIYYNRQRIHSSINYFTPVEYENNLISRKVA
jgi:transposase InsO family protein